MEKTTIEIYKDANGKTYELKCSQERSQELFDTICNNNAKGIDLYFNNCECIAELRDTNGYLQLGYDTFKECASELFEQGETQAKVMCLVAKKYGTHKPSGEYEILHKETLGLFSRTQLAEIYKTKAFADANGNIERLLDNETKRQANDIENGINDGLYIIPSATVKDIKAIIENDKAIAEKQAEEKAKANTTVTITEDKDSVINDADAPVEGVDAPVEGADVPVEGADADAPVEGADAPVEDNKPRTIKLSEVRKKLCVEGVEFWADLGGGMIHYTIVK